MPASSNALFKVAMTLYKIDAYKESIDAYRASYECFNTVNSLYNIGLCYDNLNDPAKAKEAYKEYLKHHPNDQDTKDKLLKLA